MSNNWFLELKDLIRLSVGLEDIDDLKADLKAVLTAYSIPLL
jgi:cystathionine beta-lyase/cystathionine gamma-synthase